MTLTFCHAFLKV